MEFDDFVARLEGVAHLPSGTSARCPAHDDRVSSLMVNPGEHGGIVVKCHAGCATEDVVRAVGLSMSDLAGLPYVVEEYPYTDEDGGVLQWTVQRWANPKTFRVVPALPPPAQRVLYQMPAIAYAHREGRILFVVEGERDVNTLAMQLIPATCNVGGAGAGKWLPHYNEILAGLNVVVVADNDAPGKLHARNIEANLKGYAKTVTVMYSPHGKDVTDLINAGYTVDALTLLPEAEGLPTYRASSITPRAVQWVWRKYIPAAKLSIIEGDPGAGKSVLTIDLAARWSTGAAMPDGSMGPGPCDVAMISAEDDPEDTLRPRLERAGANLERVHLVPHGATPEVPFDLVVDLPALREFVVKYMIKVLVIDPLSAFLPERVDSHNDASVRRALQPLKMLASATGAAVVIVRHLNKASGGKAMYRGGGSIGFNGAARCTYVVAAKPDDEEMIVFACIKNNLARKQPALTYSVEIRDDQPYLKWGEAVSMSAQQLLDGPERRNDEASDELASKRKAREYERAFLLDVLRDGPLSWNEVKELGKQDGFTEISLRRARSDLSLVQIDRGHNAKWSIPESTQSNQVLPLAPCSGVLESQGDGPKSLFTRNNEQGGGKTGHAPSPTRQDPAKTTQRSRGRDQQAPVAPLLTQLPIQSGTQITEQLDQGASDDYSGYPDGSTEDQRDSWLDELPVVCSICHATGDLVTRYYKPWWVARCVQHNPRTYGDGI